MPTPLPSSVTSCARTCPGSRPSPSVPAHLCDYAFVSHLIFAQFEFAFVSILHVCFDVRFCKIIHPRKFVAFMQFHSFIGELIYLGILHTHFCVHTYNVCLHISLSECERPGLRPLPSVIVPATFHALEFARLCGACHRRRLFRTESLISKVSFSPKFFEGPSILT